MKNLSIIILIIISSVFLLCGCSGTSYSKQSEITGNVLYEDSPFCLIQDCGDYLIVYHKDTLVMYVVSDAGYSRGNFELLVDEFGNPLVFKD